MTRLVNIALITMGGRLLSICIYVSTRASICVCVHVRAHVCAYGREALTSCGEVTKSPMDTQLYIDSVWALVHPNNLVLARVEGLCFFSKKKKAFPAYACFRKNAARFMKVMHNV